MKEKFSVWSPWIAQVMLALVIFSMEARTRQLIAEDMKAFVTQAQMTESHRNYDVRLDRMEKNTNVIKEIEITLATITADLRHLRDTVKEIHEKVK